MRQIGTSKWMAPEMIQRAKYSYGVDIWALGITAIELADGKVPDLDIKNAKAAAQRDPPQIQSQRWSSEYKDFVSKCLTTD